MSFIFCLFLGVYGMELLVEARAVCIILLHVILSKK